MAVVGIRQLSRDTSRIIKEFQETGEPVILTREGQPIGALMPVDQRQLEDLVLATAPEFRESARRAQEDVQAGRARSLEDVARERGVEPPSRRQSAENEQLEEATEPSFEEGELDREQLVEMAEAELSSLSTILLRPVFERISSEAADEINRLSAEVVQLVTDAGSVEPADEDVREVTELTAAVYGRLFRQRFLATLRAANAEQAIEESRESVAEHFRSLSRDIVGSGSVSFGDYEASLRGVSLAYAWSAEDSEEEQATGFGAQSAI